jgi:ribosomal protein L11 methyltransferase
VASSPALDLKFALGPGAGTFQDMLYAELDEFEPVAIHEHETGDGWRVFFRTFAQRDGARGALASEFGNALLQLTPVNVDDEDWARRSQASLTAVRVGRLVIAPPWDLTAAVTEEPAARSQQPVASSHPDPGSRTTDRGFITIVIDPSMGFGTGHHATTRLCLELLQRRDVSGARVIDVGTGSGILAIAARKLGAAHVVAIDNDPDALQNAQDNVDRNGTSDAIEIVNVDLSSASLEPADAVLANLTGSVLQRHAATVQRLVNENGSLILSGFSGEEIDDVAGAFHAKPQEVLVEGEWAALLLDGSQKPTASSLVTDL